jgi:hypothetical protein
MTLSQKIAATIVVAQFVFTSFILFSKASEFPRRHDNLDSITSYENRFTELRRILPSRGVVGYATELPSDKILSDAGASAEYYITQYSLAPIILDNTKDHSLVVGNFHGPSITEPGLALVRDFGNGVMLFGRKEKE